MNKRLRKKKRVGEFRELGFRVRFETPGLSPEQVDALIDRWLDEAIESNGLACGGSCGPVQWDGFVQMDHRGSATNEHREAVTSWLKSQSTIKNVEVSPLIDAWYGPFDAPIRK
jgi:hypothetical protein